MLDGEQFLAYEPGSVSWRNQLVVIFLLILLLFVYKSTTHGLSLWRQRRPNLTESVHNRDEESSLENEIPIQSIRDDYTTTLESENRNGLRLRGRQTPTEVDLTAILSPSPDIKRAENANTNTSRRTKRKDFAKNVPTPQAALDPEMIKRRTTTKFEFVQVPLPEEKYSWWETEFKLFDPLPGQTLFATLARSLEHQSVDNVQVKETHDPRKNIR